ncbi:MAG: restriction endonuclease subunit S, partial [Bacteroidales bacterium]|nr:restriction endonuclease subunit S [Bacteroidales bacterium]
MKEGWIYKKLGEIATTINGLWKGKKEPFVNVGVIRNTNFTKDITLDFSKIEYLNVEAKQYQKRKLQKGDLIVEKSGGSEKQPVGRTVLFNAEGEFSVSNFTSILRINNQNEITPEFLYKYLLYVYREGRTKEMQNATTGIHNIIFEKFLAISIPIPPLPDQQRIVTYLDAEFAKIEALKANAEKQLQAAKDLFQAALKELLTPKEGWKMKTIDSLQTDMYRGSGITREQIRLEGVPCVRYGEIYTTYNYW